MKYRCILCCDEGKIRGVAGTEDSFCECAAGIKDRHISDSAKKAGHVRGGALKVERMGESKERPKPHRKNLRKKPTSLLAYAHKKHMIKKKLLQGR